jgi:hypothetical protein
MEVLPVQLPQQAAPASPTIDARWVASGLRLRILLPLALALAALMASFVAPGPLSA